MTKPAVILATPGEVRTRVHRIAAELSVGLSARAADDVVMVAVLKGSLVFLADLVRAMSVTPIVDFLAVSPYAAGTGRVRLVKDLDTDIGGRHVVLVEDIVDTGLTLAYLTAELSARGPASIAVCTLVDRPARRIVPASLDYVGFEVPDVFVLGYGLDYRGRYRNLALLAAGELDVLSGDPDAYLDQLYRRPDPVAP